MHFYIADDDDDDDDDDDEPETQEFEGIDVSDDEPIVRRVGEDDWQWS